MVARSLSSGVKFHSRKRVDLIPCYEIDNYTTRNTHHSIKCSDVELYRQYYPSIWGLIVVTSVYFIFNAHEENTTDNLIQAVDFLHVAKVCEDALEANQTLISGTIDLMFLDIQMLKITGIDFLKSLKSPPMVILTTCDYRYEKIHFKDILYIEGMENYVVIYTTTQKFVTLLRMKTVGEILPASDFIRIHKSFIVSLPAISSIAGNEIIVSGKRLPISREKKSEIMERVVKN